MSNVGKWLQPVVARRRVNGEHLYQEAAQNHVVTAVKLDIFLIMSMPDSQQQVVLKHQRTIAKIVAKNASNGKRKDFAKNLISWKNVLTPAMSLDASARMTAPRHAKSGPMIICAILTGLMSIAQ